MKRWFLCVALAIGLSASPSDAGLRLHGAGNSIAFTHVPIGGAGAVIGVSSVPSANVLLARTDQFNCYISISNSQWSPLLKATNTPAGSGLGANGVAAVSSIGAPVGLPGVAGGSGGCVADPQTGTNVWVESNGGVFVSTDSGTTFSGTCYPAQADLGPSQTQATKNFGHVLAVDPANSSIAYMGTMGSSLWTTFNKGTTCFAAPSVATPSIIVGSVGGDYLIAFDSSNGTLTNVSSPACPHSATLCTRNVYVSVWGTGVYKSTDGGTTFTLQNSAGMPTTHIGMKVDPFGNLWFIDNPTTSGLGTLRKYNGTWSTPSGGPTFGIGVDIDPNACASAGACHIAVIEGGGTGATSSALSTNGGTSWNRATTITTVASDVAWLATFLAGFGQFPGGAAYDNSGHVYTGGEGVFFNTPPTSGAAVTFNSQTAGIEEAETSSLTTSSGTSGKLAVATWDLNCFVQLAQPYTSFPTTANRGCNSTNGTGLQHTYFIDWASATPAFLIALTDNQAGYGGGGAYSNFSGTSTDGGATWSPLSGPPIVAAGVGGGALKGGCIAAASTTNFMWAPTDGSGGFVPPYYTTDGGSTWHPISVSSTVPINTSAATASGATLTFTSVPASVLVGGKAYDDTAPTVIPANTTVLSKTATTVVLSNSVTGAGVGSGNLIVFSGGGWPQSFGNITHDCASDRVNANTFYIYNFNDGVNGDIIVKCTAGGATCTNQSHPNISPNQQFFGQIKSVPGQASNLFLSLLGNSPVDGISGGLWASTDGGATTSPIANIKNVFAFGFGAAAPGHTYPAIVFVGFYNGVYGVWQSIDWDGAKTWQKIGDYPKGLAIWIMDVDGDKAIPGVFYYATISGVFCSAPSPSYCNGGT